MSESNDFSKTEASAENDHAGEPPSQFHSLELLKWTLDSVQEQIRFADSKAAFVVLFHTFLFGFLITQAETLAGVSGDGRDWLYWFRIGLLTAYAFSSCVSVIYAIRAVIPKFGEGAPPCKTFFGHIVAKYGRDYGRYHHDALSASKADWLCDLTSQIVENSNIAVAKHQRARIAAHWAAAAILFAFLGIVAYFAKSML